MPIYEYVCSACGNEFEAIQKFSDKPLTKCTCGKKGKVARKMSAPSFHLQGGGWYNEGYSAKKDGSGKSETKPVAKTETKSSDSSDSSSGTKTEKKEPKKEKKVAAAPASA